MAGKCGFSRLGELKRRELTPIWQESQRLHETRSRLSKAGMLPEGNEPAEHSLGTNKPSHRGTDRLGERSDLISTACFEPENDAFDQELNIRRTLSCELPTG